MVNIAILSYGGSGNYFSMQSPLYKKLSKKLIDSVAVLVTNQYEQKIYFEEQCSDVVVLHICHTSYLLKRASAQNRHLVGERAGNG